MKKSNLLSIGLMLTLVAACSNENDTSNETTEENDVAESNTVETDESSSSSAESQSTSSSTNLFDSNDVEEGYWIGQSGQEIQDSDMIISNFIDYNPNTEYQMNRTAYVSYYNGEELLSTILHSGSTPITVQTNEEADRIRISFDTSKLDNFELNEN